MADYTGDDVDESTAANCIAEAKRLVEDVFEWRKMNKADLVPEKKSTSTLPIRPPPKSM